MRIRLSAPDITEKEIEYVNKVLLESDGILSIGPWVKKFEDTFRNFTGKKYAIAVNSGTSALFLLAHALGWKNGNKILTTPFSFVASANAALFVGANPEFVDIDIETYNMDLDKAKKKISDGDIDGIVAVDAFGQPIDMTRIINAANDKEIKVIEDSCEALGSEYKGIKAGTLADAGTFAFYPNKQITTGEGGIIITDNEDIYKYCISARSQGRATTGLWLEHKILGYNFRMSELNAALGVAQMERINEILEKRNRVAGRYYEMLKNIDGIKLPYIDNNISFMSWFVFVIRVSKYDEEIKPFLEMEKIEGANLEEFRDIIVKVENRRKNLISHLKVNEIDCKPYFTPIHLQEFYRNKFGYKLGDFPITEYVGVGTIAIPFYTNLSAENQRFVADTIHCF